MTFPSVRSGLAVLALGLSCLSCTWQARPAPTPTPGPTSTPIPTGTPAWTPTPTETATPPPLTYIFPIQPSSVASYQRGHHDYPAADIFAPWGTSFVAVTNGVVDYVTRQDLWDPAADDPAWRGGLSVAIIGDDGVRYYGSHLSAVAPGIEPGVRVQAGQLLGQVGNSGNARYVAPHLHFGISPPTYAEDWAVRRGVVDPYWCLRAWEQGWVRTPKLP